MCEELYEAFEATAVMAWPDGALEDHAAQLRYHDIAQEILTRILEAVQDAMGVAFVDVAREVIERERKVQRRGKPKR
jgi:hypothetical protein